MARRLIIERLNNLTLVQKGKATAKHPHLREGVVEVVKATPADDAVQAPVTKPPTFEEAFHDLMHNDGGTVKRKLKRIATFEEVLRLALHPQGPAVVHKATPASPYPNLDRYRKGQYR